MPKTEEAQTMPAEGEAQPGVIETPRLAKIWTRRSLPWALSILCFAQLGLLIGVWQQSLWRQSTAVGPKETMPEQRPALATAVPAPDTAADVARGEDFIREGRCDLALALYSKAAGADDALQYRVALCQEGLGHWDAAVAAYRGVTSRNSSPQASAAAQLGQARVWVRLRRPAEAAPLLGDLILRSAQLGLRNGPFLADARYLLAFALSAEALPDQKPQPYSDAPAGRTGMEWPVDRFLKWADLPHAAVKPAAPSKPGLQVQCLGPTAAETLVSACFPSIPAAEVLEQVSALSRLQCRWTPRAREQAVGRCVRLETESLPATDLLRAIADPLGLVWEINGTTLQLSMSWENDARSLAAYRAQSAERAMRSAVLAHPDHALSAAAHLDLGNLELQANRFVEAISWYDRIQRDWPRTPEALAANYNLGLAQAHLGHLADARQAFFRVVDQGPGHELAPLAYWHIGRLFLEEDNNAVRAIAPLRRALATSAGSAVQPAAALLLSLAYIEQDNARAAIAMLKQYHEPLAAPPYQEPAAFLDAYAVYESAADRQGREGASGNLLTAMLSLHDPSTLGSAGPLLLGRAYRELGLLDRMAAVYQAALPKITGPRADEMAYSIADALDQSDQHDRAVQGWTALAKTGDGKWNRLAKFRLAQAAFETAQQGVCLDYCRELLRQPDLSELPTILRLMGRAYSAQGKYAEASRCFAGELPD